MKSSMEVLQTVQMMTAYKYHNSHFLPARERDYIRGRQTRRCYGACLSVDRFDQTGVEDGFGG